MNLYPLKFHPRLKERLWGGTRLRDTLGKSIESEITGESWEISAVRGDASVVANGPLAGKSLQELIDSSPEELLGKSVASRFGREFPILVKFLDARQDLSIQLHPDDKLARERHNSFGKTEMWYIMEAEPGAKLIIGFEEDVTPETYKAGIENDTLTDLLHYESVKEGDTFFISPGKVHAIGAGILLAEIQQTSDVTYRIFDFNRRDKAGNLRELHTDLALDAIDYKKKEDFKVAYTRSENQANKMVHCPYFKTDYLEVRGSVETDLAQRDSFTIFICVDGSAVLVDRQEEIRLKKGETLLVPACSGKIEMQASFAKFLEVTV